MILVSFTALCLSMCCDFVWRFRIHVLSYFILAFGSHFISYFTVWINLFMFFEWSYNSICCTSVTLPRNGHSGSNYLNTYFDRFDGRIHCSILLSLLNKVIFCLGSRFYSTVSLSYDTVYMQFKKWIRQHYIYIDFVFSNNIEHWINCFTFL